MSDERAFGKMLRDLREEADYRLTRLAIDLEVSVTYLSDVERGSRPPLDPPRINRAGELMKLSPQNLEALHAAASSIRGSVALAVDLPQAVRTRTAVRLAAAWPKLRLGDLERLDVFVQAMVAEG
jgi:transcriptional regulator with XRE-family HTH domain